MQMEDTMIQTTFRRPRGCLYTLNTPQPVEQNVMDNVAHILRTLRNREFEVLVVTFTDREVNNELFDGMDCVEAMYGENADMLEVNAYYRQENAGGEGWGLEWYSGELTREEATEFFRKVLVDCAVPEERNGFKRKWQKMS